MGRAHALDYGCHRAGEADSRRQEVTRDALMFTLLTWARTGETRFAARDEFDDLDGPEPLWRLSPGRMKMEREHVVPLSVRAVEIVRRRLRATNGGARITCPETRR
ncbi:hypothetical protein ASE13_02605 [Sphingomonas sp. Root241]|nr:hypothetical protein ASE13_02605 [Sphingomonas sp. Root241]